MFATINLEEFTEIIELFNQDNEEPCQAYINMGRLFIEGTERQSQLMLRFNPLLKCITIATIQFAHTKKGYGSQLLQLLKEYANQNGYEKLCIESILTEEAYCFAIKHGFKKEGEEYSQDPALKRFGNYFLEIK